ncbi:chemotaxis protein CheW [Algisphaera agarilytica]|uniref:Purine-binding chemotaxis protein CheW n=1 Tax=Algisphaera agarilytica TaxID=1385975 RepID=A0A7X0LKD1_9BACT|nr:chemotaxis protein CheW [Algisphaera agarilytica]MBB6429797.1 purine-binding chemotaxis protein CheW [Algisphaera agarilytica]
MSEHETTNDFLEEDNDHDLLQLVSFEIGVEEYAIPILAVQEINRMMPITRVPHSPAAVEGVINLRGRIIPVIDMRKRFGLKPSADEGDARVIVVEVGNVGRVIGFTVDRVHEVLRLDKTIIDPAPTAGNGVKADFICGVGKLEDRLLILIDLERLFTREDFIDANGLAA